MKAKGWFEHASTAILVLCALTVTGMVVRREFSPQPTTPLTGELEFVEDWPEYVSGDQRLGASSGAITIIEFSDFQCPYCKRFASTMDTLLSRHTDITYIFRNFPLNRIHPYAKNAATAALCASAQGMFHDFHDHLFAHQDSIPTMQWILVAKHLGVMDLAQFWTCLESDKTLERLRGDSLDAVALDIRGTPMVIVNGWTFPGTPTVAQIERLVKDKGMSSQ
jgi:protein-disulfide isomerase